MTKIQMEQREVELRLRQTQSKLKLDADIAQARVNAQMELLKLEEVMSEGAKRKGPVILPKTEPISVQSKRDTLVSDGKCVLNMPSVAVPDSCRFPAVYTHRRTGRHFTGGAEKICPETNSLP